MQEPNPASRKVYNNYQWNAAQRGLPFEIDYEDFLDLINDNCVYCGSPPERVKHVGKYEYAFNGIDRKNNSLGYTLDNVVTSCSTCNRAKFTLNCIDFDKWIERLIAWHSSQEV